MTFERSIRQRIDQVPAPLLFPVYDWKQLYEFFPLRASYAPHTLDFIRHGESEGNANGLVTGSWDAPLTQRGVEQARILSHSIHAFYDIAYCSVLSRSKETLRLAAEDRVETTFTFSDQRINERSLGVLEGKSRRDLSQYALGDLSFAPAGGESYLDLTRRVLSFLVDLFDTANRHGIGVRVLVSTHAGPLRVLAGVLDGITEPREVLAREFSNARLYSRCIAEVSWPRFLPETEYLNGR